MTKKKLSELNLPELKSLYELLNDGIIDGCSTRTIEVQSEGYAYGHEKWKEKKTIRLRHLENIKKVIVEKSKEINFDF